MNDYMMVEYVNPQMGKFVDRYNMFFSTIDINSVEQSCYYPNTRRKSDILNPGDLCIVSENLKGGLCLQAVMQEDTWVGVNTMLTNRLVEHILSDIFPDENFKREVRFSHYRADFASPRTIIEVKHVHWKLNDCALFPDRITKRGTRQIKDLCTLQSQGYRCYVIYVVQRNDVSKVTHSSIDTKYTNAAEDAKQSGIKFLAFNCTLTVRGISIFNRIQVL